VLVALAAVLAGGALVFARTHHERYELPRAGAPDPAFPLAISANGRYLLNAQGVPFRLQSEFAWMLATKASPSDIDTYLADRKAKGFNAFTLLNIDRANENDSTRANVNGDLPFSTENDLSTPNDTYFGYVDMLVDKAGAQGFAVLMFYTYAGYAGGSGGWYHIVAQSQNTKAVCYNFGRYLANRWKNKPNLVLMAGGDYTMPAGETRDRMHEIHRGLREGGCTQLAGSEWGDPDTLVTAQGGYTFGTTASSDLNLNSWYGEGPSFSGRVYQTADKAWANSPILPSYVEESMQGYGKYAPVDSSRPSIRKYQHWAVLGGGTAGSNWGMFELANQFVSGQWQAQLNDVMAQDQARNFALYKTVPWWLMRPSGTASTYAGRLLVVSANAQDDTHISASIASDGTSLLAYVPPTGTTATTLQLDLRSMVGPSRARWWNPTTGSFTDITQGQYTLAATLAAQSFTTPGDNGTGTNDWMIVLDAKVDPNVGGGGSSGVGGATGKGGTGNGSGGKGATANGGATTTGDGGSPSATAGGAFGVPGTAGSGTAPGEPEAGGAPGNVDGHAGTGMVMQLGAAGRTLTGPGSSGTAGQVSTLGLESAATSDKSSCAISTPSPASKTALLGGLFAASLLSVRRARRSKSAWGGRRKDP